MLYCIPEESFPNRVQAMLKIVGFLKKKCFQSCIIFVFTPCSLFPCMFKHISINHCICLPKSHFPVKYKETTCDSRLLLFFLFLSCSLFAQTQIHFDAACHDCVVQLLALKELSFTSESPITARPLCLALGQLMSCKVLLGK